MNRIIAILVMSIGLAIVAPMTEAYAARAGATRTDIKELNDKEAVDYCRFYIATFGDESIEDMRQGVAASLMVYIINTKKLKITVGPAVTNLLIIKDGDKTPQEASLLMVYLAGEVIYCFDHKLKKNNEDSYVYGMNQVVDAYAKIKERRMEELNKLLDMMPDERDATLRQLYNDAQKEIEEAQKK